MPCLNSLLLFEKEAVCGANCCSCIGLYLVVLLLCCPRPYFCERFVRAGVVAFHAVLMQYEYDINEGDTLLFDNVLINEGSGYVSQFLLFFFFWWGGIQ